MHRQLWQDAEKAGEGAGHPRGDMRLTSGPVEAAESGGRVGGAGQRGAAKAQGMLPVART